MFQKSPQRTAVMFQGIVMLLHSGCIMISFYGVYILRSVTDLIPGVQLRIPLLNFSETMMFAGLSALIFVIIGHIYEIYTPSLIKQRETSFLGLCLPRGVTIACMAYIGFGFLFPGGISRFVVLVGIGVSIFMLLLVEHLVQRLQQWWMPKQYIALYGQDDALLNQFQERIQQTTTYTVEKINHYKHIDPKYILVLIAGNLTETDMQAIVDSLRGRLLPLFHIRTLETIEDTLSIPARFLSWRGMLLSPTPLQGRWYIYKRLQDICLTIFGGFLLLPFLCLIALMIKKTSPGPVLYIQKRVGRGGKIFDFIKFRTMYTHLSTGPNYGGAEAEILKQNLINSDHNIRKGVLSKFVSDPRVTKIGAFLRKTSLDELPSLWNVLRGDMALVGPRPHEPSEVANYSETQKRLLTIQPGITGYAQLYGRDAVPFEEEAKLDLRYIQHWTYLLDWYILLATCKVVVKGR